ncbi:NAD(P)H-dependent flavin oxidoreductase [Paracoccus tegillarcae]|uniref:Propionate 3-nitronate monooxygenase n=1 Tax=Paracoccus tegillarcae TaxID=1529068 RepID=A0A2K9F211_9RHOB|nr:nitronate monooxygenase [Paracoccus tegillarcae]AUH33171.1 nitronate monooxygenase [Paracoccus tegillarcae]
MFTKLGIEAPVIQAPMAGVSTAELTAAIANAGGLGFVALGTFSVADASAVLDKTHALTDRPFGVNLFCHEPARRDFEHEAEWLQLLGPEFDRFSAKPPAELHEMYPSFRVHDDLLSLLIERRPPVISFHFGLPRADQLQALKETGAILLATATNVQDAQRIAQAGLDGIVAQGWQAGGHRGVFDPVDPARDEQMETLTLLEKLREVGLPLIAAGGIMTAGDRRAAMQAGASAVQCGTAFLLAPEAATSPDHRARLTSTKTQMTRAISGRPARGLINRLMQLDEARAAAYPMAYDAAKALSAAAMARGDHSYAAQWAGTGAAHAVARPAAQTLAAISG